MKYKGKELVEMTPEKWDGKTRDMLVWDTEKYAPVINTIVGYTTNGQWLNTIGDESNHCAEIPNQEYNIDKMIKVLNAYKEGKKIEGRKKATPWSAWYCLSTPTWNFNVYEYRISENSEVKNNVRKMTNKELAEWLAKGNGQFKNGNFGSIKTVLVYTPREENTMVDNTCLIRAWNEDTWHEPLIKE